MDAVLQDATTVTTACYTLRRMANLTPNTVLPLVCQRFEVTRKHSRPVKNPHARSHTGDVQPTH